MEDREDIAECDHCGVADGEAYMTDVQGDQICETCIDEHYATLACGTIVPMDEAAWCCINNELYRVEEVHSCSACGEHVHESNLRDAAGRGEICTNCAENGDYAYPEDRGYMLYHIDDLYYHDSDGCLYTYEEEQSSGPLYCYSTDVFDVIDHKARVGHTWNHAFYRDGTLAFGVELETDPRDDWDAESIAASLMDYTSFEDYGICKEDGSVDGPELVTLPGDLEAHQTDYPWSEVCGYLRPKAKGYYGHNNGMHVHASRAPLTDLQLGRLLIFLNDDENLEFLSTVAQRNIADSGWCKIDGKYKEQGMDAETAANERPDHGKYSILNVTGQTVEFRMFKASLLPERILKNIEFCHAAISWCADADARKLTPAKFCAYVARNVATYPNLSEFLAARCRDDYSTIANLTDQLSLLVEQNLESTQCA
jgi:hypothetical protein